MKEIQVNFNLDAEQTSCPICFSYISNLRAFAAMLYGNDSIAILENYINKDFPALSEADAEVLTKYPLLNHETFSQFYRTTSQELSRLAQKYDPIDYAESLGGIVWRRCQAC
jgi:hypothetical protein